MRENSPIFRATLEKLLDLPIVGDVRGDGYFFGIELVKDKATKETFDDDESERLLRGFLSKALFDAGLYCRADDRGDPVVQLAPPLTIGPAEFDEIEGILRGVLTEAWTRSSRCSFQESVAGDGRAKCPGPQRHDSENEYRALSFWHDSLVADRAGAARAARRATRDADVAIVGGGLTGLWTAWYLPSATRICASSCSRRRSPDSAHPGATAAGAAPCSRARRRRSSARTAATPRSRMRRAMIDTVDEVGRAACRGRHRLRLREGRHGRLRALGRAARGPRAPRSPRRPSTASTRSSWWDADRVARGRRDRARCSIRPARAASGQAGARARRRRRGARRADLRADRGVEDYAPHDVTTDRGRVHARPHRRRHRGLRRDAPRRRTAASCRCTRS